MSKKSQHEIEIEGAFNVRNTTLELVIACEYDLDGYFDVTTVWAESDRRNGEMVEVTERLRNAIQADNWDYLYSKCVEHSNDMAEYYRDQRRCA